MAVERVKQMLVSVRRRKISSHGAAAIMPFLDDEIAMSATADCDDAAPSRRSSIPVVVVESHQHVLEHIHAVLRHRARVHSREVRQRQQKEMASNHEILPLSLPPPISVIHFDSHPDLACPSPCVPARACFEPRREWPVQLAVAKSNGEEDDTSTPDETSEEMTRNLYEHLDLDRSGIAQWILPLVFSGDLTSVHWIRSAWADQIEDGQYCYNVGAWVSRESGSEELPNVAKFTDLPEEAIMKVDFDHKYYLEDNSTVPSDELVMPKILRLKVSNLSSTANNEDVDVDLEEQEWILDVCLDYFLCRNPFVDELEEIDTEFAAAFVAIVEQAQFSPLQYQQEYERFQKGMAEILESLLVNSLSGDSGIIFQDGCGVEENLVQRLLEAAHKCTDQDRSKIIHLAIDALPSVTLPHDEYVDDDEALRSATVQIEAMEAHLRSIRTSSSRYRPKPMMITVARSTDDGFTPKMMVDILQRRVLAMVHRVYCSCNRNDMFDNIPSSLRSTSCQDCRLNIVYDYGEWEGSELDLR